MISDTITLEEAERRMDAAEDDALSDERASRTMVQPGDDPAQFAAARWSRRCRPHPGGGSRGLGGGEMPANMLRLVRCGYCAVVERGRSRWCCEPI